MPTVPTRPLLLLVSFSSLVVAFNVTQCLVDFKNDPNATVGGVDPRGNPTSVADAVGFTYQTCVERCGSEPEVFHWDTFTQLFASWLLPWLALISGLPFHSGSYMDDFISVIMSVGSPALAAYTLVLTSLNIRLVYRRARMTMHESSYAVARALISLQQTPLELTRDERLLAFIPVNDQWRREIINRHNRSNTVSIETGTCIVWAVITFFFALADSFVSLNSVNSASESISVGTLWLWLLCLVIGWLWVPTFTVGELRSTLRLANLKAAEKAVMNIRKARKAANKAINAAKTKINDRLPKRTGSPVPRVEVDAGLTREDTNPIPGPSNHHLSVSSLQLSPESQQGHSYPSIGANPTTNQDAASVTHSTTGNSISKSSIHPGTDRLLIPMVNLDPLHRDEFRPSATFNYSRVMRYLVLVDDVWKALDRLAREKDEKKVPASESTSEATTPPEKPVFPPGALRSMLVASVMAFILQFGVTAASAIIFIYTPTVGLGCYSLGYILYGIVSLLVMYLTMASTILVRISETRDERSIAVKRFTAFVAIAFRRTSFLLALLNTAGLIFYFFSQFSRLVGTCYCLASVIGRGKDTYVVVTYDGWLSVMRTSRILASILAAGSLAAYMIFLRVMSSFPSEIDHK